MNRFRPKTLNTFFSVWPIYVSILLLMAISASGVLAGETIEKVGCRAEWFPAKEILVHTPGQELFLGVIHPAAALFERSFSIQQAAKEHRNYIRLLKSEGARVHTVVQTLLAGTLDNQGRPVEGNDLDALRNFAASFLTFDSAALPEAMKQEQISYKKRVIDSLDPLELVSIILQRPTVHLRATNTNTGLAATYEMAPTMNLYFLRDQMITTPKGVVISKMNSPQRAPETQIIKFVLSKLGVKPVYEIAGEGRLEGGDFFPAGDTAFIAQGLRTNSEAIKQMLANQVFGVKRVVVVKDSWKDQEQMHLDTYFNIVGPKLAVLVEDRLGVGDPGWIKGHSLKVDVYEMRKVKYQKVLSDGDFVRYMANELGFTLIPISNEDQRRYGINFLTFRANRIFGIDGVSRAYKDRLTQQGIDATWMDFCSLTGGYGAAHCSTQVLRRQDAN